MAHLLRGKQAGIQKDLTPGITPELFAVDDVGHPFSQSPYTANSLEHRLPVMASIPRFPLSLTMLFNLFWLLGLMIPNMVLA